MKKLVLVAAILAATSSANAAKMMQCNDQIHDALENIYGVGGYSFFEFVGIDHNRRTGNSTYLINIESAEGSSVVRLLLETRTCEFVSSQVAASLKDLDDADRLRSQMDEENQDDVDVD